MELHFVRSRTLAGLAISAFEGGLASHVGISVPDHQGEGEAIIDTSLKHGGVRAWHPADWHARYELVQRITVPLPDEAAGHAFLQDQLYKPYDWTALVGFVMWRDWSSSRAWYCSELAAAAMMAGGLTLADRQRRIGVRLLREVAHARRDAWLEARLVLGAA